MKNILGKIAFGSLFMLLLPSVLIFWAIATNDIIQLPVPQQGIETFLLLYTGAMLLWGGMFNLYKKGKGLPMNAFPPKFFVSSGMYALTAHPIYAGAVCLSFGISALLGSSAGFWLVSPVFMLMAIAYVKGYEEEHIGKLFGLQAYRPVFALPMATDQAINRMDILRIWLLGILPWTLVYQAFVFIGPAADAKVVFPPVTLVPVSVVFYVIIYLQVILLPFFAGTQRLARQLIQDIQLMTFLGAFLFFLIPVKVEYTPLTDDSLWSSIIATDRSFDSNAAALPSFHVIWAFLCAFYFTKRFKRAFIWYTLAVLISLSCMSTGNHALYDLIAGLIVFLIVYYKKVLQKNIRLFSEKIANSWLEWRFGSVRIINHGFYAAACGFIATFVLAGFLATQYAYVGACMCFAGISGAALWAQWVEGSPKLQRPFGYYGSVIGAAIAAAVFMIWLPLSWSVMLAAVAMSAPWVQVMGRFRCLVQGCCHGKICHDGHWSIRFHHQLSRVNKISALKDMPLYPTQLFSIASNFVLGLILIRLYQLHMSANFITGIYLIGNSLSRFIEEAYRGETQTPYYFGLRLYQWVAVFFLLTGIVFTMLPSQELPQFLVRSNAWVWSLLMALFAAFAYGVDFPESNRRFARLTSVD